MAGALDSAILLDQFDKAVFCLEAYPKPAQFLPPEPPKTHEILPRRRHPNDQ
jgi:hypothetical protein